MRGVNILCPLSSQERKNRLQQQREIFTDLIIAFSAHCAALLPYLSPTCLYLYVLMSLCLCVLCAWGSVLDVNDETPTFNPRVYNVSLKESVPRDHTVARLSCSDNDAGLNAELSYFITGQRSQCVGGCGGCFVCLWASVLYSEGYHVQVLCLFSHLCPSPCDLYEVHACVFVCLFVFSRLRVVVVFNMKIKATLNQFVNVLCAFRRQPGR